MVVVLTLTTLQLPSNDEGHRSHALPYREVNDLTQHDDAKPRHKLGVAILTTLSLRGPMMRRQRNEWSVSVSNNKLRKPTSKEYDRISVSIRLTFMPSKTVGQQQCKAELRQPVEGRAVDVFFGSGGVGIWIAAMNNSASVILSVTCDV